MCASFPPNKSAVFQTFLGRLQSVGSLLASRCCCYWTCRARATADFLARRSICKLNEKSFSMMIKNQPIKTLVRDWLWNRCLVTGRKVTQSRRRIFFFFLMLFLILFYLMANLVGSSIFSSIVCRSTGDVTLSSRRPPGESSINHLVYILPTCLRDLTATQLISILVS